VTAGCGVASACIGSGPSAGAAPHSRHIRSPGCSGWPLAQSGADAAGGSLAGGAMASWVSTGCGRQRAGWMASAERSQPQGWPWIEPSQKISESERSLWQLGQKRIIGIDPFSAADGR